jgi:hypothetical protein
MLSFALALITLFLVIPYIAYVMLKKDLWNFDWYLGLMLWTYVIHDGVNAIIVLSQGLPA